MSTAARASGAEILDDPGAGPIPFIDLQAQRRRLGERINQAVLRVLDHGKYILGPEVHQLETQLAEFSGARHAVTCSSGTDALLLILMAWEIGPKDAVFVPTFTFAATAEVVALLGATPIFCDVLVDSFNLNPKSLEAAIDVAKRHNLAPRAVIAVDLFGQPADYRHIEALATAHGLKILADAAQSFGATLDERRAGTMGDATATSFFPAKPLGCYGDGGAVLTADTDLAEAIVSLRVHGKGTDKYDNQRIGINGRLDTMQAAILLEKLAIFEDEIAARQAVADRYVAGLAGRVRVPELIDGATSVWAQYTIALENRDNLASTLKAHGIPTAIYYPRPLHLQSAYRDFPRASADLPVSERLARQVLSLPMHPYLEPQVQDGIIEVVRGAVAG